jgi:copper transport protein
VAAIAFCIIGLATPRAALAHATLLRSTPAANSLLDKSPEVIRLVFSEQVVPSLSQIAVVCARGDSVQLKIANDPHDVHVLTGPVGAQLAGSCRVVWRVLSADGHPVSGNFAFDVAGGAATASSTPVPAGESMRNAASGVTAPAAAEPEEKPIPIFASLFRGVGLGAFMAGVGILFFGVTAGVRRALIPGAVVTTLIGVGTLLLMVHAIAWLEHASSTGLTGSFLSSMLGSTLGRVELLRIAFAALALWAIALAKHRHIALGLGIGCLIVSGAVGHPAALHPFLAIPAKILHLLAGAAWLGGLLWLVWVARHDEVAVRVEAQRVSSVALVSVILIVLSGLLQTALFLNTPSDLVRGDYGRLVLAKIVGLLILVGFGAYNRFSLLPRLESGGATQRLARSAKQEIAVVAIVIIIGGFLAYVPTPPIADASPTTTGT